MPIFWNGAMRVLFRCLSKHCECSVARTTAGSRQSRTRRVKTWLRCVATTSAGMQLCLMYALEATDCHKDTLIACGEQPVLIDLEMLLTPRLADPADPDLSNQPVDQILGTVMHTLLLPIWYPEQTDSSLINGLGGPAIGEVRVLPTEWQATNTDAMRLQQRAVDDPFVGKNMPRLHETIAPPQRYQAEIVDGFQCMYRFLIAHRWRIHTPESAWHLSIWRACSSFLSHILLHEPSITTTRPSEG